VVALERDNAWLKGNKQFGAIHRGKLYLFTSADYQKIFLAEPDRYSPALAGYDPVLFADQGELVEGRREFGIRDGVQVYLFANLASRQRFEADPNKYLQSIQQAMARVDQGQKLR
jgi:YHS domain-containing protein